MRLENLLAGAIEDLEGGWFQSAQDKTAAALREQPDNRKASEISEVARTALSRELFGDALRDKLRDFRHWLDDMQRPGHLDELLLKWPSLEFWGQVQSIQKDLGQVPSSRTDDLAALARFTPVSFDFEDTPLVAAVRVLQSESAIDITLESTVREKQPPYSIRSLVAQEMPLASALDAIVAGQGLAWKVDGRGIVIHRNGGETTTAALKTKFYQVQGLLAGPPNATAQSPAAYESVEAIVTAIQAELDPAFWRSTQGATISSSGATLVVKATDEVHDHLKAWLAGKRAPK